MTERKKFSFLKSGLMGSSTLPMETAGIFSQGHVHGPHCNHGHVHDENCAHDHQHDESCGHVHDEHCGHNHD